MSYREPFYVFPRKLKSGKRIYYYQAYKQDGSLSYARSTGLDKIGAAKSYCRILFKKDRLIPEKLSKSFRFNNYFEYWWKWGPDHSKPTVCPYLTRRYLRGQKPSYAQAHISRLKFKKHILSYFSDTSIQAITTKDIEEWLDNLAYKKLSGKTQADILSLLRIMFKEARRLGDIEYNPVSDVIPPLKSKPKKRGILTTDETMRLFSTKEFESIWDNDIQAMSAFLLARDTAMRPGEIRAIQKKHIHIFDNGECKVDILQAVDHISHQIKETKTSATISGVPVRSDTAVILKKLYNQFNSDEDLLFSKDGVTHVSENYLKRRLYKALNAIGICEKERKERNITPYSFRNLAITRLRQQGVSDLAVRSLARHKTQIMTDGYTSFDDKETIDQIRNFYIVDYQVPGKDAI